MLLGSVGDSVVLLHILFAPREYSRLPGVLILRFIGLALANILLR